ncbi:MAG: efflux RND transporter periplasmic adaptor subunit [Alphaproteobacteria bacterium]|nr:efflux RND transporter periplasmic adaptor subunit [Alphaproteobacteria bacterium]
MTEVGAVSRPTTRKTARRPRRMIWAGIASAVVLAVAVVLFSGLFGDDQPPPQTVEVVRGDIEKTVNSLGSLQPKNYVDVGAQVSGQLVKVHFNVGDKVEKGELLAELDARVLESKVRNDRASIDNYTAQLKLQRAQLKLAQEQADRNKRLYQGNAVSEDELQTSETAAEVAKSQVASTQAQLSSAQASLDGDLANLGYTKIYAPISGTVVSQSAYLGQTLNANQTAPIVLRVADLTQMTVEADVSEADVVKLRAGMPAYFTTLGTPDRRWTAMVRQIMPTPEITNDVVLYKVLLDVDNTDGALMTDMTAQVFFIQGQARNVLIVPVSALEKAKGTGRRPSGESASAASGGGAAGHRRPRGNGANAGRQGGATHATPYRVEVMGANGPEERRIMVGLMNRTQAEVLSGLKEGEQVILPVAMPSDDGGERNGRGGRHFGGGPRL